MAVRCEAGDPADHVLVGGPVDGLAPSLVSPGGSEEEKEGVELRGGAAGTIGTRVDQVLRTSSMMRMV